MNAHAREESGLHTQVGCDHTLHYENDQGDKLGSWIQTSGEYGVRVACKHCDRLYGYIPNRAGRSESELHAAYMEQRSKQTSVSPQQIANVA